MKIKTEELDNIVARYLDGKKTTALAEEYGVSKATINKIVRDKIGRQVIRLTEAACTEIVFEYKSGCKIKDIAEAHLVCINTITRILQKTGDREYSQNGKTKGGFSESEKEQIINLYADQHRGKSYIGKLLNRSDGCISYWLKKWGVENISRSKISTVIRKIYGPTNGFNGRSHTADSKNKTATSMKQLWLKGERKVMIGKPRTYDTVVGRVLGSYEVSYVQMCIESGEIMPEICHKRYTTPYGTYKPDFFRDGRFVEIKSEFTLRVAKGQYHNNKSEYSDTQWKKICYFMENIAELDVIVLDKYESSKAFSRFIKHQKKVNA